MATLSTGYTWQSGDTVTPALLNQTVNSANITNIANADVASNAAIALSKLATGALPAGITVASANLVDGTIVNADISNSAAITHSKLANITAGQVLLGNASNVPTATALSGDVTVNSSGVTAIGSAKVLPAMLSQRYTLATAQNSTSGTSIDFTGIPSWARRITIMFDGVSTNGTSAVIVQVGDGSVVTSGYLGSGGTIINASTSNGVNRTNGFALDDAASASAIRHGTAVLTTLGTNKWVFSSVTGRSDGPNVGVGGGSVTLSGALDRVRITTVGGTNAFDAGVINIAYEG